MGYEKKLKLNKRIIITFYIFLVVIASVKAQTSRNTYETQKNPPTINRNNNLLTNNNTVETDSMLVKISFLRRLGIENRPENIFPTNVFLKGINNKHEPLRFAFSLHLKYSFLRHPGSLTDRIYGSAYQGIGLSRYTFGDPEELGNPVVFYIFQGAQISELTPVLSLNYEWNFGLSFGWKPYDLQYNPNNRIVGSKTNAYISTNLYLDWMLSHKFDLTTGITLTHFSNGNTKFPNKGLNTVGGKVGLVYNFSTKNNPREIVVQTAIPEFPRHISYDLVLFGAGCRTGVDFQDGQIASPEMYTVLGFYFAPMYNINYRFRAGASIDGNYNGSANIYTQNFFTGEDQEFFTPPIKEQLALGLSARAEYIMPYFTVGIGLGKNIIHGGGDLDIFYQTLALKMELTQNSFIHIGYSIQNFDNPNFLMLGVGYRFNNKYPVFYR